MRVSARPGEMVKGWDLTQMTPVAQYRGHGGDILGVALRPDGGQIATVSMDQSFRLWQASQMKPPRTLVKLNAPVWTVLVGAQEKQFLTASADQTAGVWDIATGRNV